MINNLIDKISDWPMFGLTITENSNIRAVRVFGVIVYAITFIPLVMFWAVIAGMLAIPAMIEDAWKP